jgi:hypothetical protein
MPRLLFAAAGAILAATYAARWRPEHLQWGASDEEIERVWPGR